MKDVSILCGEYDCKTQLGPKEIVDIVKKFIYFDQNTV